MEKEIFKDIKGYEGLYQVSNYGRVKSLYRIQIMPTGGKRIIEERILKTIKNKKGYIGVHLSKNNKDKTVYIHRLVAQAFIPNPNNYPQVNHKDEDKTNNHVDNLEWCTAKYNSNYGHRNDKIGRRKVRCITTGKEFNSLKEAGEYYNCKLQDNMSIITNKYKGNRTCGYIIDSKGNKIKLKWEYI